LNEVAAAQNNTNLVAGTYKVTVTDANGCSIDSTFTLTQPDALALTATVTNPDCNGANGSITLTVAGGTPIYNYTWNDGSSDQDRTNLAPGTYTVTVSDAKGCTLDSTFTITQPNALVVESKVTDETCAGLNNGKISILSVTGGTEPYSYKWSNGATTKDVTNLSSGNYHVIITDGSGCSDTIKFTINPPEPMTITTAITSPTCVGGNDGAIEVTSVTGGKAPLLYYWSTGETTQSVSGLTAGVYELTIMDNSACAETFIIEVNDPAPITVLSTITDESCIGNDGSISLEINGGSAPYTFNWNNGEKTQALTGLKAGNYTVEIEDSKGCKETFTFTVNHDVTFTVVPTIIDVKCHGSNDGSITLTISGGIEPYSDFIWSNGATTKDISDLAAGTYSVKFRDEQGCNHQSPDFIVNQPDPLTITADINDPSCKGASNGSIIITSVTGGTAPYYYLWPENVTTKDVTNLGKGIHQLILTDANNCTLDTSFVIGEPDGFVIDSSITNITCYGSNNGSITIDVTSGGTAPYNYQWNTGDQTASIVNLGKGVHTVVITDAEGCKDSLSFTIAEPDPIQAVSLVTNVQCYKGRDGSIKVTPTGGTPAYSYFWNTSDTSSTLSNLKVGTYTLTITDQNFCTKDTTFIITQPDTLVIDHASAVSNVSCNGKSDGYIELLLNITGGTAPYTNFQWTPNSLSGQNNYDLPAGVYMVEFYDANNCIYKDQFEITEPQPVTFNPIANPNPICKEKTVTITVPEVYVAYSFNGGISYQTSNTFSKPIYSDTLIKVTVMDANYCESKIDSIVIELEKLEIDNLSKDVSCFGLSDGVIALANFKGGSGNYMFGIEGRPYQLDSTFTGLEKGTYLVSIYDLTGCLYDYTVEIKEPEKLALGIDTILEIKPCANSNNGEIHLEVTGGNGDYRYSLNNGPLTTTPVFTNLSQNSYLVKVIDQNGCADSLTAAVTAPDTINITNMLVDITAVKCFGDQNGAIKVSNITGGLQPYIFTLNGIKNNTGEFENLPGGNATLVISNKDDQCPVNYPLTIPEPDQLITIMTDVQQITCIDEGSVTLNAVGGTAPYMYAIDDNSYDTINVFSKLKVGTYHFTIKDFNNCISEADTTLIHIGPIPYIKTQDVLCYNEKTGEIKVDSLQGGTPIFTYYLNKIEQGTNNVMSELRAGIYSMAIKEGNCDIPYTVNSYYLFNGTDYDTIFTSSIIITEPEPITAETYVIKSSREINSGTIYIYDIQGGKPFYLISNDDMVYAPYALTDSTLNSYNNLAPGVYKIFIKDANGCKVEKEVIVGSGFYIPNMFTPNGDGKNDRFEILSIPYGSKFYVFNKWGSRVFASDNYDNSWDGENQPDGVYFYELHLPNGQSYKGWVEIIR